ncbi:MAG: hypothetical protein M1837_002290 [Sclerophora amabilis]|nr:MAG: hypothetical protein M1837_002290 [Sclerophora amabilis]
MEAQSSSRINHLASIVVANTATFDEYVSSCGLPSPSFDHTTPLQLDLPDEIKRARDAILEASTELQALVLGPLGHLQNQTFSHNDLIGLQAIYRYGIAMSFPVDEEASYEQISRSCGLNEPDLRRIMRHAMTKQVFKEPRKGFVAHTAASKVLAEMPLMRDWVGMVCEEMWPSAARTVDAMVKWPASQEPHHTGFSLANNTEDAIFTEVSKFPARATRFANAMSLISGEEGFEPYHLVDAYSWDNVKSFVDVGGSHGTVSIALAQHVQSIHCVVQDVPNVVAEGSSNVPSELAGRVTFVAHDFFTDQPVIGADVYHFRWIFHNWPDKYCVSILRCLVPALKNGARIIISEFTVPPPGSTSPYQESLVR